MSKYSPQDILRKFVLRQCIEHIVVTSETAVWINLTFWENVTRKAYAVKCWHRLSKLIVRKYPGFRMVGVWARQKRGAWHIHGVCDRRIDVEWLRNAAVHSGFGPSMYLAEVDSRPESPQKIARYISGYCTDKNGLDEEKDKGVRRMIFVGKNVRVVNMRYRSQLKKVTSLGREMSLEEASIQNECMTDLQRQIGHPAGRKRVYETWGDWYRRNRDEWFREPRPQSGFSAMQMPTSTSR